MTYRPGSILILAIWSLAVLGFLVVAVGGYVSASTAMARYLENNNTAYFLARAGVEVAVAEIMENSANFSGTTFEDLASMDELFRENDSLEGGVFSVSYTIDDTNTFQIVTNYGVLKEAAKIDITSDTVGTRRRLANVIDMLGAPVEIVDNVFSNYPTQKKEIDVVTHSRFGAYDAIPELLQVQGVTLEMFEALKSLITLRRFERWYPGAEGDEWIRRDSYGGLSEGQAVVTTHGGRKEIAVTRRISFVFDSATTNFLAWREH
jgi:hypothetical protein